MRITIDNLDGLGAVDYTGAVLLTGPVAVHRTLNAPSKCSAEILPAALGLPVPVRRGRVVISAEDATVLFTGYLATEPVRMFAGEATGGPLYRLRLEAVSDEWLLDRLGSGAGGDGLGQDAAELVAQLTTRVQNGATVLTVQSGTSLRSTGVVASSQTASWSSNAGLAASAGYAGYRALGGDVAVQPVGVVTHALSDADGSLNVAGLQMASLRELANDVTISGDEEPAAYIAESFTGDGTTVLFTLADSVFRGQLRALVQDNFENSIFNPAIWTVTNPGGHVTVGGAGFTVNGGVGTDGQTMLTALDAIEMGGTIVAELRGVVLGGASDGVVAGFYAGQPVLADCFAGFRVRQSTSSTGSQTVVVPVVNGNEVGAVYTVVQGHLYTLRVRLHCPEMYRASQRYYCMADGVVESFGDGSTPPAPMEAVFEVLDEGASTNIPATMLYDTAVQSATILGTPMRCNFVAVNATQMFGSVRSLSVVRTGSAWVVSTMPDGSRVTRLTGVAGEGVDCEVRYGSQAGTPGSVNFLSGRVPQAGERVTVLYRGQRRSVARLADTTSLGAEAVSGSPGTSRWLGKILQPPARTSADCESAAQAVLAIATSRTAAIAGTYTWVNPTDDIWPGDVLSLTSEGVTTALLVRSVAIADGSAVPEVRRYAIRFANDWGTEWADGLGLRLSNSIAADAMLPQTAVSGPTEVLANLLQLSIASLTGSALEVDTGMAPPVGGGFEVLRRDWIFGPTASGADLVLRSPVRNFSIPRAMQGERFYVRMYDGSAPRVYSRFSSALFVHAPLI